MIWQNFLRYSSVFFLIESVFDDMRRVILLSGRSWLDSAMLYLENPATAMAIWVVMINVAAFFLFWMDNMNSRMIIDAATGKGTVK